MARLRISGFDGPLLVVSNRLPFRVQRIAAGAVRRPSPGGLVSALDPVLRKRGGSWVGWPGGELAPGESLSAPGDAYRLVAPSVEEGDFARYYQGFSNRALWPLLHSLPDRARFDHLDWEAYREVNQSFASAALDELTETDLVWVQDYHLCLVPEFVREEVPASRIAFFLHVPFPDYDIFRILPWHRELIQGLLACDLIGFQVESYVRNFLDCAERILGADVDRRERTVGFSGHTARYGAFPIGIDWDRFESKASAAPPTRLGRNVRMILGADRLDYTKGIPERIRAVERFFELHPEECERVVFLQIAVPSRSQVAEYRELKREIDELVGRVNGRFATATWSPIRYIYQSLSHDRLTGLYRDADVALVTPLRDGMNLVAKEFIASQVADPGVLVLSEMAGAAETMREALLVNPYDPEATARAIHRALHMNPAERRARMESLRRRERRTNVFAWADSLLREVPDSATG